jgi:hypothetical protein
MPVDDGLGPATWAIVQSSNEHTRGSVVRAYVPILPPVGRKPLTLRAALHHSSLGPCSVQSLTIDRMSSLLKMCAQSRGKQRPETRRLALLANTARLRAMRSGWHTLSDKPFKKSGTLAGRRCTTTPAPGSRQGQCSMWCPHRLLTTQQASKPHATMQASSNSQQHHWCIRGLAHKLLGDTSLS